MTMHSSAHQKLSQARDKARVNLEKLNILVDENGMVRATDANFMISNLIRLIDDCFETMGDYRTLVSTDSLDYEQEAQNCFAKHSVMEEIKTVTLRRGIPAPSISAINNTKNITSLLEAKASSSRENIIRLPIAQLEEKVATVHPINGNCGKNLH